MIKYKMLSAQSAGDLELELNQWAEATENGREYIHNTTIQMVTYPQSISRPDGGVLWVALVSYEVESEADKKAIEETRTKARESNAKKTKEQLVARVAGRIGLGHAVEAGIQWERGRTEAVLKEAGCAECAELLEKLKVENDE